MRSLGNARLLTSSAIWQPIINMLNPFHSAYLARARYFQCLQLLVYYGTAPYHALMTWLLTVRFYDVRKD
ncbi:hypothetical protein NDU88_007958 [Pleurodeles waltl]|uniref:Uncharacterized protein n=1 Tax=Pleurodeles waltl TaxID=8319 RepID=A0AAV7VU42_PLEWA|nr:hypothetical protein NDU88_007958 [Pleurodeles waltl]